MTLTGTTTLPRLRRILATLVVAIAAALAATAAAGANGGPILAAPGGCALQCIERALVTTTASAAKVEIGTTVATKVVVTARRLSSTGGLVAGAPDATVSHRVLRTARTLFLVGLQPGTTYRIVVAATDASGRSAHRSGTFATKPVQTAVEPGIGGISSGLGCSAKCIEKAVPVQIGPTAAVFEIGTATPATIRVVVSRDAAGEDVVSTSATAAPTTRWTTAASTLDPGTRYHLIIRATDSNGRTEQRQFSFRTVERMVRITFWKVKVVNDGDSGRARGELRFGYWLGKDAIGGDRAYHKRRSGDVIQVRGNGTSRPGLTGVLPANGADPTLDIRVHGVECDGPVLMKNCLVESKPAGWFPSGGGEDGDDFATAGGPFSLTTLLTRGALPGNYGTMLPSGHDAYLVFETTQHHLKFRVYAYLDVFYAW